MTGPLRLVLIALVVMVVVAGAPLASVVLNRLSGTNVVVFGHPGTSESYTAISGPEAPIPDWIPKLPGSIVSNAHQVVEGRADGFGVLKVVTRKPLDPIKDFYTRSLTDLGFTVRDEGTGPLNPAAAAYLGIAGMLVAERPDAGADVYKYVAVQIGAEEGALVPSRLVTIQWRKAVPTGPEPPR